MSLLDNKLQCVKSSILMKRLSQTPPPTVLLEIEYRFNIEIESIFN